MKSAERKFRLAIFLLTFTLFVLIVQCSGFTTDFPKSGKPSKKASEFQPQKKAAGKKSVTGVINNEEEYGRINLGQSSFYEVQSRSREQDQGSLPVNGKSAKENQSQSRANRLRRDVALANVEPGDPGATEGYKQVSKSSKKLKLALSKGDKNKERLTARKANKFAEEDGKNISGKKQLVRRHATTSYSTKVAQPSSEHENHGVNRSKRDAVFAGNRALRANVSDYYAQRRAVMERFYARQREIAERMARLSTSTAKTPIRYDLRLDLDADSGPTTRKPSENQLFQEEISSNNYLSGDLQSNVKGTTTPGTLTAQENLVNVTPRNDFASNRYASFANEVLKNSSNVERDISQTAFNGSNCDNIPRSGSIPPKNRKDANCTEERRGDMESSTDEIDAAIANATEISSQRWGNCTGKVVYQHNLLLGVKGPSNLDTMFEVAIQGPICITCVEAVRFNQTRAIVSLESGGRGYQFIKLRLKGYENEGFSYIVKVWGIRKLGNYCEK